MTRKEAQKRAAELSKTLREYQRAYFVESRPLVSDAEYDRLFDELAAIETQFPDLALPDSPTRRVGSDLTQELPEAAHTIPVLSLDKSYTAEELPRGSPRRPATRGASSRSSARKRSTARRWCCTTRRGSSPGP